MFFSCFVVKATLENLLNFLVVCVTFCAELKTNRKRLFETFHKMLYPFKEFQSVSVIFVSFHYLFLVSMNCGYKVIKYKVDS